jgi:hypothetical protein
MSQAQALYHLQEIELAVAKAEKRLNEVATQLKNDILVLNAQEQVNAAKATLRPLQTKARDLELEIQSNTTKIRETDIALYSGRVRNPKELQDMQHEIEALRKRNNELEDVLLDTLVLVESAEKTLHERENNLSNEQSRRERESISLTDEQHQLQTSLNELVERRTKLLSTITAESLQIYKALKPRKNNQPVALLISQSCATCRVEQELAIITEARKDQQLIYCSNCGRILVYQGS